MFKKGMGRRFALLLSNFAFAALAVALTSPLAWADESVSVFDVRKTLPLDPSEPVFYDYYLNAGPEAGLKRGMFVTLVRRTPIHDPVQNKAQGTLSVEVARIKIIHVDRNLSVARVIAETGAEERPVLEFDGVMIGDELDLTTVSMDPPKEAKKPRKPAATDVAPEVSGPASASLSPATVPAILVPVQADPSPVQNTGEPEKPAPAIEAPAAAPQPPTTVENSFPLEPVPGMVQAANDESNYL